jgi:hypothetical protein
MMKVGIESYYTTLELSTIIWGIFDKRTCCKSRLFPNHKSLLSKESTFCIFGEQKHISIDNVQVWLIMLMSHVHQTLGYQKCDQVETVRSNDEELEKMINSY